MSDLIDRQAAIDALAKFVPYAICDASTESYTNGLTDAYNLICQLPSVQPQPVRCKDCKWCEDADGLMCKNPASWVVATDRDFGCVLAERRTDGGGA